jgi:hypothetical protein
MMFILLSATMYIVYTFSNSGAMKKMDMICQKIVPMNQEIEDETV